MDDRKKYLIMFGSVALVILVMVVSMLLLSSCNRKYSYSKIESKLVDGAKEAIKNGDVIVDKHTSYVVTSDQLEAADYIKPLAKMSNDNCTGYVTIMNNAGIYNYLPNLVCDNYKTLTLKDKIIADSLTTDKSGLYSINGEYVFKGTNPNNHVKFGGDDWLILGINSEGNIRMIKKNQSVSSVVWDTKFNTETNDVTGENDYLSSDIYNRLYTMHYKTKEDAKKHMVPSTICVGVRDKNNITSSSLVECAATVKDQYISLMNPTDYTNASYDVDCKDLQSGSCMNYNFFYNNISESWTINSIANNTYQVVYYNRGKFKRANANSLHYYNIVITVSGDELYTSGNGTTDTPYVIK